MRIKQNGFSLIEAVVALVILASSGMALASGFSLNMQNLVRLEERQQSQVLLDNLYQYFSTLRLREEVPNRTLELAGHEVSWSARLVEPIQVGRSMSGSISNFDLGLYEIEFSVFKDGLELQKYRTRRVGYERIRGISDEL